MMIGGRQYSCNKQYYIERKALTFGDTETARAIMPTDNRSDHKKLGRKDNIKNFEVNIWGELKIEIMTTGLYAKFSQNPDLKQYLLDTKENTLIEANPKDRFWGAGMSLQHPLLWRKLSSRLGPKPSGKTFDESSSRTKKLNVIYSLMIINNLYMIMQISKLITYLLIYLLLFFYYLFNRQLMSMNH